MCSKRFTNLLFVCFLVFLITSSCQKDVAVKDPEQAKTSIDGSSLPGAANNYLAVRGVLKIKIQDSTYSFDASRDSIAFINVHDADGQRYFGITAINKDHTMSFGISSPGVVYSSINNSVAGSQFLLTPQENGKVALQYSLNKDPDQQDYGKIIVNQYNQADVLAEGTFFTFLSRDENANSPVYRVEGSFDLQLK
jgi:hypothetical protein